MSLGGDAARDSHEVFSKCLIDLLLVAPRAVTDIKTYHAALKHGFSYYYWQWDPRAKSLYGEVRQAVEYWSAAPSPNVNVLCELLDFFYFVVWCFDKSSTLQCQRSLEPIRAASLGFSKSSPRRRLPIPARAGPYRIAWLAMYADRSAVSEALHQFAPAARAAGHDLHIYSWRFADDASRTALTGIGAIWHHLGRETALDTILSIEAQADIDRPAIMISDMNNAVPTAVFSRRSAPVQILSQVGMPAWPIRNLDAVFNGFGFDGAAAGWGKAILLSLNLPFDVASLNPVVSKEAIRAEHATLPRGYRLIGSYSRFSKITEPYLKAAEQILIRCEDAAFVLGGTGDVAAIETFISASPVGERMHIVSRFVPGHVWGHILEIFLDTWPVTGGGSAREMIAKGKPVVTLHSQEMPAYDAQRDVYLVTADWRAYVEQAVRLLTEPDYYAAACQRARDLAVSLSDTSDFQKTLAADIVKAVTSARRNRSFFGQLVTALRPARPRK